MRDKSTKIILDAMEHEPKLRALLYSYTRNMADCEEMLQETYMKLLTYAGKEVDAKAFSYVIARNIASSWYKHVFRSSVEIMYEGLPTEIEMSDEIPSLERKFEAIESLDEIFKVIETMTEKQRNSFTLRRVYGYSLKEISAILGIAEHTVEIHINHAIKRIQEIS